jgi:hypothetical protein
MRVPIASGAPGTREERRNIGHLRQAGAQDADFE